MGLGCRQGLFEGPLWIFGLLAEMSGRPQQNDVFEAVPNEVWMFEASGHRSSQTDNSTTMSSRKVFFEGAQVL